MIRTLFFLLILISTDAGAVEIEFERERGIPIVYLNVAFKMGPISDPEDRQGLAHFMSNMMLRGTTLRGKSEIDSALDQMGAVLDIETRSEITVFRGAVLSSELDHFLDLLHEIITLPDFPETEIKKFKSETVSAILQDQNSDRALAGLHFDRAHFGSHPYSRPEKGLISHVNRITRSDLRNHYKRSITVNALGIFGTGDTHPTVFESWAQKLAEALPQGPQIEAVRPFEARQDRRLRIVDKPDRTQAWILIGQEGMAIENPDYMALYLANQAFGGSGFSSRLMQEIRVKRGWSYGASSYFRHGSYPRSWMFGFFPTNKDAAPALHFAMNMLTDLKENGLTEAEFSHAKTRLVRQDGFRFNTPQKRMEIRLLEWTLRLPKGYLLKYSDRIQRLSRSEVNSALKRFIKPNQSTITVVTTAAPLKKALIEAAGVSPDKTEVVSFQD